MTMYIYVYLNYRHFVNLAHWAGLKHIGKPFGSDIVDLNWLVETIKNEVSNMDFNEKVSNMKIKK